MCLTSVLIGVGLIAVLSPSAFLRQDRVHFEITVSRQLLVGLAVLLVFVNVYMVTKRLDIRRAREHLISTTIQSELVRPQSFTDPLTEFTTAALSTRWLGDLSTMPCVRTDRSRSC